MFCNNDHSPHLSFAAHDSRCPPPCQKLCVALILLGIIILGLLDFRMIVSKPLCHLARRWEQIHTRIVQAQPVQVVDHLLSNDHAAGLHLHQAAGAFWQSRRGQLEDIHIQHFESVSKGEHLRKPSKMYKSTSFFFRSAPS